MFSKKCRWLPSLKSKIQSPPLQYSQIPILFKHDIHVRNFQVKAQKSDLATTDSVEGLAAVEAVASEKEKVLSGKRDFTGYRIYRVVIPSIEAAEWILKFEELPGVEFWADPKLLLRPRGVFVTSAADLMVAPDVVDEVEAALRQARMPFEILIKDMQVSSNICKFFQTFTLKTVSGYHTGLISDSKMICYIIGILGWKLISKLVID